MVKTEYTETSKIKFFQLFLGWNPLRARNKVTLLFLERYFEDIKTFAI